MTYAPNPYSQRPDLDGGDGPRARRFTEPLRELSVFALLAGNAVFLLIGAARLFIVIDRWATDFELRCAETFPTFVGPYALGLPVLAVLLATHVEPMVPRTRLVLLVALAEYGVSAFFGVLTFLGAFAFDLRSPRAVIEGVMLRGVWLGFLLLGSLLLFRVWRGLFPPPPPRPPVYGGYAPTTYGKPYPGQPMYPQPGTPGGPTSPTAPAAPDAAGWPEVPPPPMPAPITLEADPTTRLTPVPVDPGSEPTTALPLPVQPPPAAPETESGGDATQVVPLPSGEQPADEKPEQRDSGA